MNPETYINAVIAHAEQREKYRKLNAEIRKIQDDDDFATELQPIDSVLSHHFVCCVDEALYPLTGFRELGSYHLYECTNKWRIEDKDGTVYQWHDNEGFRREVLRMVKAKQAREAAGSMAYIG